MEGIANVIIFYLLAAAIIVSSVLAVTSRKIFRAATYLLLVLIGTAGLYLMLNYHFWRSCSFLSMRAVFSSSSFSPSC